MPGDVIIVGAGAAGLAAAAELCRRGHTVRVLEARDRLGGRIWTRHDPAWQTSVELGAEFVHGLDPALWEIIRAQHLATVPMSGAFVTMRGGKRVDDDASWGPAMEALQAAPEHDTSIDAHIAQLPEASRQVARAYVEGFYVARAAEVSAQWIAAQETAGERIMQDHAEHLTGGYDGVVSALRDAIPADAILTEHVVREVSWKPGAVRLTVTDRTGSLRPPITGERLILTLPPPLLAGLPITPTLPAATSQALAGLVMGPVLKVALRFATPVWTHWPFVDGKLSMLFAPDELWPTWWTDGADSLRLTGWIGGSRVDRMPAGDPVELAVASLARIAGTTPEALWGQVSAHAFHDWQGDPYARGAYAYVKAGHANAPTVLARGIADTVYFAGEATHPEHSGTVHGAIESGQRAALAVTGVTC